MASQDQEFWLAAMISCMEVIEDTDEGECAGKPCTISAANLVTVYTRSLRAYGSLDNPDFNLSNIPAWSELISESIDAREGIFKFRLSKLLRCFNSSADDDKDQLSAKRFAVEVAQCLSMLPLEFLRFWSKSLNESDTNPTVQSARAYLLKVDCASIKSSMENRAIKARGILIEGYLRYSLRIALGYVNRGIEYSDLVQEAALGLVEAAEKYNYIEHGRFALFATVWMWQHVTRSLANNGRLIRLPVHAYEKQQELRQQLLDQMKEVGEPKPLRWLISSMGHNVKECLKLLEVGAVPIRLDSPKPGYRRCLLERVLSVAPDTLSSEGIADRRLIIAAVEERLSPIQRDVLLLRFGLIDGGVEHTLEEIGKRRGVTRERIRQIERQAISLLRRSKKLRQISLQRATSCNRLETLEEISCDEALNPAHPYKAESRQNLGLLLDTSFGSRQSIVRQGLTIKGRILAIVEMQGMPMHTREIKECLRVSYPLERHLESTLYSIMVGSPETFISHGGGVFGLTSGQYNFEIDINKESQIATALDDQELEEPFVSSNELETEGKLQAPMDISSASLLEGCDPQSLQFPIQSMQLILERCEDVWTEGMWSIAELPWTSSDYTRLLGWALIGVVEIKALTSQRVTYRGRVFTGLESLGCQGKVEMS